MLLGGKIVVRLLACIDGLKVVVGAVVLLSALLVSYGLGFALTM